MIEKWYNRWLRLLATLFPPNLQRILWGAPGTLRIIATSSCQIQVKTKNKVLSSNRGAPGTVPFGKSGPGYCIIFKKKFDEGLS